jgi:HPt (histidine-containing phosphotransfer) domain-containing protein
MRGDRERCLASGMDDYVAKPVMPEQLAAVLQRWAPLSMPAEEPLAVEEPPPEAPGRDHVQRVHASVDWDVLKDLFSVTQAEFMSELVSLFLRETRASLVDLQGVRLHGDLPSWRRLSHKVRGSCATLGARAMMQLTAQMEALDDEGLASQGDVLLDALREEFARVEGALRAEGRRAGAPYIITP